MDGIANVAKQQQTQVQTQETGSTQVREQQPKNVVKEIQKEVSSPEVKIDTKEKMEALVDSLNKAMAPISTNLSFGVDSDDIFFVSVRETESQRLIRRFPAEQAADFLPKMQEVTGMLFDIKG